MTPERKARIETACRQRQLDLAIILENVHDPHNISAVLRSCDAVGVQSVYVVYTDPNLTEKRLRLGRKSSASAWKWVDVHFFDNLSECISAVREKHQYIFAAHIGEGARSLFSMDLTGSTAVMFGNEHAGISSEALALADAEFYIPQVGMIKSLNISVACAVSLYEAMRQRAERGFYDENPTQSQSETRQLIEDFKERHTRRAKRKTVHRKSST